MSIFEGAGVALVTPFKESGEINYSKLEELVEEQIAGGTDSIIICGTTGESATLTHDEHIKEIKFTCDVVNGRIPVIAGTGSNCTATAVYLSKCARRQGRTDFYLCPLIITNPRRRALESILPRSQRRLRFRYCSITFREEPGSISTLRPSWLSAKMWKISWA